MANNIRKQNYLVVEINPTTHETRAIPFDKCFIYDNVSVEDFMNEFTDMKNKLSKIDDFEKVVNASVETIKALNDVVASTNADVEKIFEMLKGDMK